MINVEVERKQGESIESLISRFSKKVIRSKLIKEYKAKRRFLTKKEKKDLKSRGYQ